MDTLFKIIFIYAVVRTAIQFIVNDFMWMFEEETESHLIELSPEEAKEIIEKIERKNNEKKESR